MRKAVLSICFSLILLFILADFYGCSGSSTTTVFPVTETDSTAGFTFTATVDDTRTQQGGSVNISIILKNVSNTEVVNTDLGGRTIVEVTNESGQTVWGFAKERPSTTSTGVVTTGYQFIFDTTWVVESQPGYNIPVTPGKYYINVSDTGIYDPVSEQQVTFSVEPIEVVVS